MTSPAFLLLASVVVALASAQEDDSCRTRPAGWPERPPQCCSLPFPLEGMKRQFGACIRQIGRPSSAVPTAKAVRDARLCIEECVYKGLGFFDKSLKKESIAEELKKGVEKYPLWTKPMNDAVKACFEEADKAEQDESLCDQTPHVFTHCVMRQLFLTCPASEWTDSEDCKLVKGRMEVCPNIPPPPPPPPQRPPQGFPRYRQE
ncbi:general odorant-binding protein 68-like [Cimex lectularius]|uniref:OBP47-like domain-containing protein n=1 Tax=Cimex lectularius TaxID=79782 RepID=A0A8I6RRM5_CIMLE|nr:general odorant-binding protein 68-like [Cimex lectularius]